MSLSLNLSHLQISNFTTQSGVRFESIALSYQVFGKPLHTAPVILINHALTGNSNVCGKNGWWKDFVGKGKAIDTQKYTVLCFNIPGNGFDGFLIEDYKNFIARDVARLFLAGLSKLKIESLFALIGSSLGGGIAWEMAVLNPKIAQRLIPIATDWKSTDWLIANCQIQEQILLNSKSPVHDARMHAMLCYRTPASFKKRFSRSKNETLQIFNVESWLLHHGKKLQSRFQLSAYKLMNQLLKTIDITDGGKKPISVLDNIKADIHLVGVNSDLFFVSEENKQTQRQLALTKPNVTYHEIDSLHGHDAFLIEHNQLTEIMKPIFETNEKNKKIKILKFGGKSLSNKGLNDAIKIVKTKVKQGEKIAVVVSARGNATDQLEDILEKASKNGDYLKQLNYFKKEQSSSLKTIDYTDEFSTLSNLFEGVKLLGDYSPKIKAEILAQGELLSAKMVVAILNYEGVKAKLLDARKLIKTDRNFENAQPIENISKENVTAYFHQFKNEDEIPVITGFIASDAQGQTTTLGRNGSNYTAALIANYLKADELQNYTHVDGIFTANPSLVPDAKKIEQLSFSQANELANFGATILHAKTITPLLEKNIPLRILNTFNPEDKGTLITSKTTTKGIISISILDKVALLNFEGRGLLGKVGIDARIFGALARVNISVSIIAQGSSERGIGLVVNAEKSAQAVEVLKREFENDFYTKDVHKISVIDDVSVVSIIGQDLSTFHNSYNSLIKNQIVPLLFNNTVNGKNVSLLVKKDLLVKAVNVIHGQIFGVAKKINIAIFGKGLVGGTLIEQILENTKSILERRKIQLTIFAIADSKKMLLNKCGATKNWKTDLNEKGVTYNSVNEIINFAKSEHLENLIAVDNTASSSFVENYIPLIESGFDLVSSNKIANTIAFSFYKNLRDKLTQNKKSYLYETNVGAGLPLIDTIKLLHESGENITRIRGVFSGSLSYLFNRFSAAEIKFSSVLQEAIDKGLTEPDPREDLSGNDVARKLLILARELDLENEFEDIEVKNLIPQSSIGTDLDDFLSNLEDLDSHFNNLKAKLPEDEVLRYLGDLSGDLFQNKGKLSVKLTSVPVGSTLGGLQGSDTIFEIYTESYGNQPLVIQGAGAGATVTARGVFGDILRLTKNNN